MLRSDGTSEWWSISLAGPPSMSDVMRFTPPVTAEQVRGVLRARGFPAPESWVLHPLDDGTEEPGRVYGTSARS